MWDHFIFYLDALGIIVYHIFVGHVGQINVGRFRRTFWQDA